MRRKRLILIGLALIGWTGTLLSQLAALRADGTEAKRGWEDRRNQFLLLSSFTMNTLVFTTLYRFGKNMRHRVRNT